MQAITHDTTGIAGCVTLWLLMAPCVAQTERYELGKRLRRFELAWEKADKARRDAVAEPMQRAVQSFFGLQLSKAGSWLDEAYLQVRAEPQVTDLERSVLAHRCDLKPVCVEQNTATVQIKLAAFYALDKSWRKHKQKCSQRAKFTLVCLIPKALASPLNN